MTNIQFHIALQLMAATRDGVGFSGYQGPRTYDPYVWRR